MPAALFVAGFAMFALTAPLAAQQTYTWDAGVGGTSGDWGNRTNWVDNPSPLTFGNQTDIIFSQPAMTTNTVFTFLGAANRTVRSITFGADLAGNTNLFDVRLLATSSSTSAARDLIFSADSGNASITVDQSTSGVAQIRLGNNNGGNIVLSSNLDLAQNNTFLTNVAAFQLGNSITNSGTINKTGAGVVSVVRDNSGWSGGMNINEGEVVIYANANAFGTGTWTLGGGANNTLLTVGTLATFSNSGGLVIGAGTGTRTIANAATNVAVGNATLSGAITNNKDVIFNIANYASGTDRMTVSGAIGGTGGIVKTNAGTLALSGSNSYTGTTTVSAGTLALTNGSAIADTATVSLDNASGATLQINTSETIGSLQGGGTTGGNVSIASSQTLTVAEAATNTYSGAINGAGGLTKAGNGTLILGGNNTYSGATAVTGGVLNLNNSAGESLGSTASVSVTNATLLISQSSQVSDSAVVTLSGGTIQRGAGVSEVFGNLNITGSGILDFGTDAVGNLTFGTYQDNAATPSALLTLNNFIPGNSFTFSSTSFTTNSVGNYFTFGTGYAGSSIANSGINTFTITAIPEPSTYLAAAGLLALLLAARKRSPRVPGAESCSNS